MTDVARAWLLVVGEYARLARRLLAAVAEAASEVDLGPRPKGDGDPASALGTGAAPGAASVAPTNPTDAQGGHLRTAIGARSHGGPSGWAAPTQRNDPAA